MSFSLCAVRSKPPTAVTVSFQTGFLGAFSFTVCVYLHFHLDLWAVCTLQHGRERCAHLSFFSLSLKTLSPLHVVSPLPSCTNEFCDRIVGTYSRPMHACGMLGIYKVRLEATSKTHA